eukprot:2621873-Prymnesium_polylepis.1
MAVPHRPVLYPAHVRWRETLPLANQIRPTRPSSSHISHFKIDCDNSRRLPARVRTLLLRGVRKHAPDTRSGEGGRNADERDTTRSRLSNPLRCAPRQLHSAFTAVPERVPS